MDYVTLSTRVQKIYHYPVHKKCTLTYPVHPMHTYYTLDEYTFCMCSDLQLLAASVSIVKFVRTTIQSHN